MLEFYTYTAFFFRKKTHTQQQPSVSIHHSTENIFAYFLFNFINFCFFSQSFLCFYYTFSMVAEAMIRHIGLGNIKRIKI